jgi:hypothetical protein
MVELYLHSLSRLHVVVLNLLSTGTTIFFLVSWGGVRLGPLNASRYLYQPRMIDDDECGGVGGMRFGRRNRSARRKRAPVPPRPSQTPHVLEPGPPQWEAGD